MDNFDLRKYLAEGAIKEESFGAAGTDKRTKPEKDRRRKTGGAGRDGAGRRTQRRN